MKFHPTPLRDAYTIELERRGDDRGFFARVFCENEFSQAGLESKFVQVNDSLSAKKGTLRGMHYQLPPKAEVKLVRCVRGALWDAILDLRPDFADVRQVVRRRTERGQPLDDVRAPRICPRGSHSHR